MLIFIIKNKPKNVIVVRTLLQENKFSLVNISKTELANLNAHILCCILYFM